MRIYYNWMRFMVGDQPGVRDGAHPWFRVGDKLGFRVITAQQIWKAAMAAT
jgi:hypothetical protein